MMYHHTSLAMKGHTVQKICSGQTFNKVLNLHCNLDLEYRKTKAIFSQDVFCHLSYDDVHFELSLVAKRSEVLKIY